MNRILTVIAGITVLLFIITQLIINSSLNPQGAKLQQLNREKNHLIESNRKLEEELSYTRSVTVISEIATQKLNLSPNSDATTLYISDPTYATSLSQTR